MGIIASSFKKLYKEYLASGLSVRDFCANQDFAVSTFYRWKKLLEAKEPPLTFVPLTISAESDLNCHQAAQNLMEAQQVAAPQSCMVFTFPNGTKLELSTEADISLIKNIIHLY